MVVVLFDLSFGFAGEKKELTNEKRSGSPQGDCIYLSYATDKSRSPSSIYDDIL